MAKKKNIQKLDSKQNLFSENRELIVKKNCKLCQSAYREEAEALFHKTNNVNRVFKLLSEDRGEDLSYNSTRNHLLYHYCAPSSMELVQSQIEEINKWQVVQHDQMSAMIRTMALLDRELHFIEAGAEAMNEAERRKNADTVAKLSNILLNYRAKYQEMEEKKQPILRVLKELKNIMQEELKKAKGNANLERSIKNILEEFQDRCGDMVFEYEEE